MQYGNTKNFGRRILKVKFKSYYVVWKPGWSEQDEESDEGLNRTMQYGNGRLSEDEIKKLFSLNRTMQYGN